ncbi:hypothetical protein BOTBODRAFT_156336 [Botryobasidium botryosum FD-172 SS1]|uniref:Actin-like ATPase domain-containing protein n=1 Tax=Botryobasidium botryosum (strain FD-172 SS1) TaxID=930990 RepID=A0A067MMG9_BOTB1|nr:hypothetical protein BOTBODRAFT_156336 [Botryobasidium botryosum FD-172 SS1]
MAPAKPLALLLFSLLLVFPSAVFAASVLAIDYGSDWMKASLMKPGVPFDVLLNRDSKRKIQSSIGWKGEDRLFGSDAFNLAARFPLDSFSNLKSLQGAAIDSIQAHYHAKISPATLVPTERGTVAVKTSSGAEWSVEELVAMQFAYVKELAEGLAGSKVYDVVVTVPSYFSQFQRQAVLDSIELAGLRPLALLNDGTAVAINYAMTRTFPETEHHIIYDAGASSIRATVVSFSSKTNSASTSASTPVEIETLGFGYDLAAGGTEFDRRLRLILAEQFESKNGKSLKGDAKAMAKLWKEAGRVKAILSANADSNVAVESLYQDIDFKSKVSRQTFEKACADLKPRFTAPITDALTSAGLTLNDIKSVILTGGASRTPMIQAAVRAAVGDAKIAQNVNADEASVLGAALYGASLSPQFKTKEIKVQDIAAYNIQISYAAEPKTPESKPRTIQTPLFYSGSKTSVKKTLTLKRKDDFSLRLAYKDAKPEFPQPISEIQLMGVAEAIANLTERGAKEPVVKVTVLLSDSTIASVVDAVAHGQVKDDSIKGKLKGLFGSNESKATEDGSSEVPVPTAPAQEEPVVEYKPGNIQLKFVETPLSIKPLSAEFRAEARKRLIDADKVELAKRKTEEARNFLEGYLYRLRDLLDGEETTPFMEFSKESEREKLAELHEETLTWFNTEGDDADQVTFWAKREALEALEKPIQTRYEENETGPGALTDLQQALFAGRMFLTSARQNETEELAAGLTPRFTADELEWVEKQLVDNEKWLEERLEVQKTLAKNDDPAFTTAEMKARGVTLQTYVLKLMRRKQPKVKPTSTSSSSSATSTSTSTSTTRAAEETAPPVHEEL